MNAKLPLRPVTRRPLLVLLTLFTGLGVSCGDNPDAGDVTITFHHTVADAPLVFNSVDYINPAGETYNVTRLEYILTDAMLVRANGTSLDLQSAAYINAADPSTTQWTKKVPGGQYSTLSFRFGVPAGTPFGDLPNSGNLNQMEWPAPMGGGYHYMRLEGLVEAGSEALLSHLGPSRGTDYSFVVDLPIDLYVDGEPAQVPDQAPGSHLHVTMEVDQWWQPNPYTFAGRGMIMGDADAQALLSANGENVFSVVPISPGL